MLAYRVAHTLNTIHPLWWYGKCHAYVSSGLELEDRYDMSILQQSTRSVRPEMQKIYLVDNEQSRVINEVHGCPCPTI